MQGDEEAIRLYEAAAEELALIIGAVYRKLEFSGDTIVSYSGGLFHAGDFILKPLVEARGKWNLSLSLLNIRLYRERRFWRRENIAETVNFYHE